MAEKSSKTKTPLRPFACDAATAATMMRLRMTSRIRVFETSAALGVVRSAMTSEDFDWVFLLRLDMDSFAPLGVRVCLAAQGQNLPDSSRIASFVNSIYSCPDRAAIPRRSERQPAAPPCKGFFSWLEHLYPCTRALQAVSRILGLESCGRSSAVCTSPLRLREQPRCVLVSQRHTPPTPPVLRYSPADAPLRRRGR